MSQIHWQLKTDCFAALRNSQQRKIHFSTLPACFLFVDVTMTLSSSALAGVRSQKVADIDLFLVRCTELGHDMLQNLDAVEAYFCNFCCQDAHKAPAQGENGKADNNCLKKKEI